MTHADFLFFNDVLQVLEGGFVGGLAVAFGSDWCVRRRARAAYDAVYAAEERARREAARARCTCDCGCGCGAGRVRERVAA